MIAIIIAAARLCAAIASPEVDVERACSAALVIVHVADEFDPALIAAIAYGESRYQPDAISPDGRDCGPMGVRSRPSLCRAIRADEWTGYRHGVRRLREARAFCERRASGLGPDMLCVLAGYASGPDGVRGRWYRVPRRVLHRAAVLRARIGARAKETT